MKSDNMFSVSFTNRYYIKRTKVRNNHQDSLTPTSDWLGNTDLDKSKLILKSFNNLKLRCQKMKERVFRFKDDFMNAYDSLKNPVTTKLQNQPNKVNLDPWGSRYKELAETYHSSIDCAFNAPSDLARCGTNLFSKYSEYIIKSETVGTVDSIRTLWANNSRPRQTDMIEKSLECFNIKMPQMFEEIKKLSSEESTAIRNGVIRSLPDFDKDGRTLDHLANYTLKAIQESTSWSPYTFSLTVFSSAILLGSIFILSNKFNPATYSGILTRNSIFSFEEDSVVNVVKLSARNDDINHIYTVGITDAKHPALCNQDTVHFTFKPLFEYRDASIEPDVFNDHLSDYLQNICLDSNNIQSTHVYNYIQAPGERLCLGLNYHVFNWEDAEASFDIIKQITLDPSPVSAKIFPILSSDFITFLSNTSEVLASVI